MEKIVNLFIVGNNLEKGKEIFVTGNLILKREIFNLRFRV